MNSKLYILQESDTDFTDDTTTFKVHAISNDISKLRLYLREILQMTDAEMKEH